MGARAWVFILGIGLGSVLLFGFLTKFAIDATPDLQAMIRFKAAFARDFDGRGVGDVLLKKAARRGGHQLLVTIPKDSALASPPGIDVEIAEYFLDNFEAKPGPALSICYRTPGDVGCEGPTRIRETEIAIAPLKARLADRSAAGRLAESIYVDQGCLLIASTRDGKELRVEIEAPVDQAGDLLGLARELEPAVRREFRGQPYATLRMALSLPLEVDREALDGSGEPALEETEVRFDSGGRELAARPSLGR